MQQPIKYFHKTLDSTNMYASRNLADLMPNLPVWIRTDEQTAGKGQGNNKWITEPGLNLTGSLVISPIDIKASDQFVLSQSFSMAALTFLRLFLEEVTIKWPNDLYVSGKKIGGILIETGILGSRIEHAVLGIGINVNQLEFPDDLPNPVSIRQLTGIRYNLVEMEDLFIQTFINSYADIEGGCFERINDLYINNLYRLRLPSQFASGGQNFIATIIGTDEYGQLKLLLQNGTEVTFGYQEVQLIS